MQNRKMNVIIIISVAVLLVVALCALYMRVSCKGLWEKQVSKIPTDFLSIFPKKEGQPDNYSKCVYVGFRAMFSRSTKEDSLRDKNGYMKDVGQSVTMTNGLKLTLKEIIAPKADVPGNRVEYQLLAEFDGLSHEFGFDPFNSGKPIEIDKFPPFTLFITPDNLIEPRYLPPPLSVNSAGENADFSFSKTITYADPVTKVVLWTAMFNTDLSDPNRVMLIGKDGRQTKAILKTYVDEKNGFAFEYPEFQGSVTELLDYEKPSIPSENTSISYLHYRHRFSRFPLPRSSENVSEEVVTDRYIEIKVYNKTVPAVAGMPLNKYGIPRSRFNSSFVVNYDNQIYVKIPEEDGAAWFSKSFIEYLIGESIRPIDQKDATFQNQQKAIRIAEKKVLEKYPNFKRSNHTLLLIKVDPVKGRPGKWFVRYDMDESVDASVEMIVDINTGEITDYQDSWA